MRSSVLLPQPLRPMMPSVSPAPQREAHAVEHLQRLEAPRLEQPEHVLADRVAADARDQEALGDGLDLDERCALTGTPPHSERNRRKIAEPAADQRGHHEPEARVPARRRQRAIDQRRPRKLDDRRRRPERTARSESARA